MNNIIQKMNIDLELLHFLATHPDEVFTVDGIRRQLGGSYATTHRRVHRLASQGLAVKAKYGSASQVRVNFSEKAVHLLAYKEALGRMSFMNNCSHMIRDYLEQYRSSLTSGTTLIFGSYAKNLQRTGSDLDILVISPSESAEKTKKLREKSLRILKTFELLSKLEFNPITVRPSEHAEMLLNKEMTVGNEALLNHVVLFGEHEYWNMVSQCFQKKNSRRSMKHA